jgi:hypothetical protein
MTRAGEAFRRLADAGAAQTPPPAATSGDQDTTTSRRQIVAKYIVRLVDPTEEEALHAVQRALRDYLQRKPSYSEIAAAAVVVANQHPEALARIADQIRLIPRRANQ